MSGRSTAMHTVKAQPRLSLVTPLPSHSDARTVHR